jgi:uncharacterized protein (TIGR00369 family)
MPRPLDELARMLETYIPFNQFLGIRIASMKDGTACLELPYRPEFIGDPARPAIHGGAIATLIDTAAGFAVWTRIEPDDRLSTVDLRIDYVTHGRPEALLAEATVIRLGNRLATVDVRSYQPSDEKRTVATGKGVFSIRRKGEV